MKVASKAFWVIFLILNQNKVKLGAFWNVGGVEDTGGKDELQ